MTWSATPVDGSISVKANETPINDAFTYIGTNMADDHYWGTGGSNDGHHKAVQQIAQSSDPTLASGMNLAWYPQVNTSGGGTDAAPIAINSDDYKFYCGFRALVNFTVSDASNVTVNFHHNIDIGGAEGGVERISTGIYRIHFLNDMQTTKYVVNVTAMGGNTLTGATTPVYGMLRTNSTYTDTLTVGYVDIQITNASGTVKEPRLVCVTVTGG